MSTQNSKSPLVFVDKEVNTNSIVHLETVLRTGLIPWAMDEFKGVPHLQYGVPSHTSKLIQVWVEKNNPKFLNQQFWPPCC